jgi:hypothetical protein
VEFSLSREEELIVGTQWRKMMKEKHDVMAQLNKYIGINWFWQPTRSCRQGNGWSRWMEDWILAKMRRRGDGVHHIEVHLLLATCFSVVKKLAYGSKWWEGMGNGP